MLPAVHRMRQSEEFSRTFTSGVRKGTQRVVLHVAPASRPGDSRSSDSASLEADGGAPAPRVGFVVSKAVGNAVTRNRVKRRLRAVMAGVLTEFESGSSVVVRALPASADASSAELRADLDALVRRVQVARRRAPR